MYANGSPKLRRGKTITYTADTTILNMGINLQKLKIATSTNIRKDA
jgi:hypothetical protein